MFSGLTGNLTQVSGVSLEHAGSSVLVGEFDWKNVQVGRCGGGFSVSAG